MRRSPQRSPRRDPAARTPGASDDTGRAGRDIGLIGTPISVSLGHPEIDIIPGSDVNNINPMSLGFIKVAILGSDTFDVLDVDVTTLAFGPSEAQSVSNQTNRDLNRDGNKDLLAAFRIQETGIALGDDEACLTGEIDGVPFESCDDIQTVPGACGIGFELTLLLPPIMWLRSRRLRRSR